jgi:transcriptional regulator with XRE-family HTH domain
MTDDDDLMERDDDLGNQVTDEDLQERITNRRAIEDCERLKQCERWLRPQRPQYDPTRIAKNLRALMKSRDLSLLDTIRAISDSGEYQPKEYRWLRRVVTVGIAQTDNRTLARLKKLADYFNVTLEDLRTHDLDRSLRSEAFRSHDAPDYRRYGCLLEQLLFDNRFHFLKPLLKALCSGIDDQVSDENTISSPTTPSKERQHCVQMLFQLLDTGTHDYLRDLITELYGNASREAAAQYERMIDDISP